MGQLSSESKHSQSELESSRSGNTKRNIPSRRGGPRGRRFAGNIPTVSPSLWRNHPKLVLAIWTRKSTWFPPISLLASSISSSERGSVSDPRTLSSSLSTTSSPPPPPLWGHCIRNTTKKTSSSTSPTPTRASTATNSSSVSLDSRL